MYTEQELQILAQKVLDIYEPINQHYIELMGEHLKDIGTLTATDIHRATEMQRLKGNAKEIAEELSTASRKSVEEIEKIFEDVAKDYYSFSKQYYTAQGLKQVVFSENKALLNLVKAQAKATSNTLINLSNTTASSLLQNSTEYKKIVDKAISAVSVGYTDYNSVIRSGVKQAVSEGLGYIKFDSGYKRNIRSQIKMNILDGISTTYNNVAEETGKQYGADAVEISVHSLCAKDHLFFQGRKYLKEEWEKINDSLDRKLGTLNCSHKAFPTLMKLEPQYTEKQLQEIAKTSTEEISIKGKDKNGNDVDVVKQRVDWDKQMRDTEDKIRKQKDLANAYKASGDDTGRRIAQANINALTKKYNKISNATGIRQRKDDLAVSGFRNVKTTEKTRFANTPQTSNKGLKSGGDSSIINTNDLFNRPNSPLDVNYKDTLVNRFNQGTSEVKRVYEKYVPIGGAVTDGKYTGTSRYSATANDVRMNFSKDKDGSTWYHEHGHYIDGNSGRPSRTDAFVNAIKNDVGTYEKSIKMKNGFKTISGARNFIADEFVGNMNKTNGIQDIYGGVIKKPYRADLWHHTSKYWKDHGDNGLGSETLANMFEASFDPIKSNFMKKYLPTAWELFEKMLGGL